jgi:hypothetical protein
MCVVGGGYGELEEMEMRFKTEIVSKQKKKGRDGKTEKEKKESSALTWRKHHFCTKCSHRSTGGENEAPSSGGCGNFLYALNTWQRRREMERIVLVSEQRFFLKGQLWRKVQKKEKKEFIRCSLSTYCQLIHHSAR